MKIQIIFIYIYVLKPPAECAFTPDTIFCTFVQPWPTLFVTPLPSSNKPVSHSPHWSPPPLVLASPIWLMRLLGLSYNSSHAQIPLRLAPDPWGDHALKSGCAYIWLRSDPAGLRSCCAQILLCSDPAALRYCCAQFLLHSMWLPIFLVKDFPIVSVQLCI